MDEMMTIDPGCCRLIQTLHAERISFLVSSQFEKRNERSDRLSAVEDTEYVDVEHGLEVLGGQLERWLDD